MLELPPTVRVPIAGEMSHRPDMDELLQKRKRARITPGYLIKPNNTRQLSYRFHAAINVNNSNLWQLFLALAATLPDKISCVYGIHEEEAITTDPLQKTFILTELEKYNTELSQDTQLEFGLLYHTKDLLIELSVTDSKYIKYWGVELERFKLIMQSFGLPAIDDLEFIDEYPKVVTSLRMVLPTAKAPESVLYHLNHAFRVEREATHEFWD